MLLLYAKERHCQALEKVASHFGPTTTTKPCLLQTLTNARLMIPSKFSNGSHKPVHIHIFTFIYIKVKTSFYQKISHKEIYKNKYRKLITTSKSVMRMVSFPFFPCTCYSLFPLCRSS